MAKKHHVWAVWLIVAAFSAACASDNIIVDPKGVDMDQFEADLAECKKISEQVETGNTVGKSALFGAAILGGLSAVVGGDVKSSAAQGGIIGGSQGALKSDYEEKRVVRNCLTNRGYKILN